LRKIKNSGLKSWKISRIKILKKIQDKYPEKKSCKNIQDKKIKK
jgi:hypothetical protein